MNDFVQRFKELRAKLAEEGVAFPSVRAWNILTEENYDENREYEDDYYTSYKLTFNKWQLTFTDCYTSDVITDVRLWQDGECVFYSGEE